MIHYTWIIFISVVLAIIARLWWNDKYIRGDYSFDLESPFLMIILVAFVLVWGGVFWW